MDNDEWAEAGDHMAQRHGILDAISGVTRNREGHDPRFWRNYDEGYSAVITAYAIERSLSQTPEQMLRECHTAWGAAIKDAPDGTIPESTRTKRAGYLDDEVAEYHEAVAEGDIAHIAKEGCDVLYVMFGNLISMGVPVMECIAEVHRSNMTKTPAGDGKAIKGPGYEEAEIERIIRRAMDPQHGSSQPRDGRAQASCEPGFSPAQQDSELAAEAEAG